MDSFTGEIRMLPYTYAPLNWAFCDGEMVQILQNPALYTIIGTMYGGDGVHTFALPNLQACASIGTVINSLVKRTQSGEQAVALQSSNLPSHTHTWVEQTTTVLADFVATAAGNSLSHGEIEGTSPKTFATFAPPPANVTFPLGMLSVAGQSTEHQNMQPYLVLNFCISLEGEYPPKP